MIEEEQETVLATFIGEIQAKFGRLSREIVVPFMPDMEIEGVEFRVPVRGDKLALLELSARNAKEMRLNALKQQEHTDRPTVSTFKWIGSLVRVCVSTGEVSV